MTTKPVTKRAKPPTDSQGYVLWGDPDADVPLTRQDRSRQAFAQSMVDSRRRGEEKKAGYPEVTIDDLCPSCGLPFRDDIERPFRNQENEEQVARREAEDAAYHEKHKDCHAPGMVYGNGPRHCGECCPWPSSPVFDARVREVQDIMVRAVQAGIDHPETIMRWRVRLFCGHVVERSAHASYKDYQQAMSGSTTVPCPECGMEPSVPVAARAIGLKGKPKPQPKPKAPRQPTLAERIQALEAENRQLREELASRD